MCVVSFSFLVSLETVTKQFSRGLGKDDRGWMKVYR